MAGVVEVRWEGMPECRRMIQQLGDRELQNTLRRGVYAGAKVFQPLLSAEAVAKHGSAENVPESFRKVRAPRRSTRFGDISAYVRPASPLFNIFQVGSKAHEIRPGERYSSTRTYVRKSTGRLETRRGTRKSTGTRLLGGQVGTDTWTMAGRKRPDDFWSAAPVMHPGFGPRDILSTPFEQGQDGAIDAVAEAIFTPSRTLR